MTIVKDFIKKNSNEFHSLGPFPVCDNGNHLSDGYNKIFLVDYPKALPYFVSNDQAANIADVSQKLSLLAMKVEENVQVFAELELLIRNVPVQETKCNIRLIEQNLLYFSSMNKEQSLYVEHVRMNLNSPLASLGCVAQILMTSFTTMVIDSCKDTAAVCYMFAQLCYDVGLNGVCLLLVDDPTNIPCVADDYFIDFTKMNGLRRGCFGIITEQANVKSAVDSLFSASYRFPWVFRRIVIHESIGNVFKDNVDVKNNENRSDASEGPILELKYTDLFQIDNKAIVDVDTEFNCNSKLIVFVQIYSDIEELQALINKHGIFCLSIWSNNEIQSNNIAFGVEASIVWINDINIVDGPPKSSQSFYSHVDMEITVEKIKQMEAFEELIQLRNDWLRLDIEKRLDIVCKAVENCISDKNEKESDTLRKLRSRKKWDDKKTVEVIDNKICTVLDEPVGFIGLPCFIGNEEIIEFELLRSVVEGNAILLDKCQPIQLLKMLKNNGTPIVYVDEYSDTFIVSNGYRLYKTKVIRSKYNSRT